MANRHHVTKITNQNQWVRKVHINNLQDCLKIFLPKIKVKFDIDLCTHDNGSNNDLANLGEDISLELQSPADVHLLELVEALNRRNSMLIFLKNLGQTWPLFPLFSSFYHSNINFHNTNRKKRRWCAWDLNPGLQDGRHRRNQGAMAAPSACYKFYFKLKYCLNRFRIQVQ